MSLLHNTDLLTNLFGNLDLKKPPSTRMSSKSFVEYHKLRIYFVVPSSKRRSNSSYSLVATLDSLTDMLKLEVGSSKKRQYLVCWAFVSKDYWWEQASEYTPTLLTPPMLLIWWQYCTTHTASPRCSQVHHQADSDLPFAVHYQTGNDPF